MLATSAPEQLWFLNTLVTVRVSTSSGAEGFSVLEHRAPRGDSPPLHLHGTEDEAFHVLEGTLTVRLDESDRRVGAGDWALAPLGAAHTYRVDSDEARWVTVTGRGDFERFVRALSRPAEGGTLPPAMPPTPEAIERLVTTAARFGIEIVGPPLS